MFQVQFALIPTVGPVAILVHDVIDHAQNAVHHIWQVSGGLRFDGGGDVRLQQLVVLNDDRLENGEQSCGVGQRREDGRTRQPTVTDFSKLRKQLKQGMKRLETAKRKVILLKHQTSCCVK